MPETPLPPAQEVGGPDIPGLERIAPTVDLDLAAATFGRLRTRRARRRRALKLVAAVTVLAVAGLGVASVRQDGSSGRTTVGVAGATDLQAQAAIARFAAKGAVLVSVVAEARALSASYAIGVENAFPQAASSTGEMDAMVDAALSDFEAAVGSGPQPAQDAYRPIVTTIRAQVPGLRDLLRTLDERSLANPAAVEVSNQLANGYAGLIGSLLDAGDQLTASVPEGELRNGMTLVSLVAHRQELEGRVLMEIASAAGLVGPDQIGPGRLRLAATSAELDANVAATAAVATQRYAGFASRPVDPELVDLVASVLAGKVEPGGVGYRVIDLGTRLEPTSPTVNRIREAAQLLDEAAADAEDGPTR